MLSASRLQRLILVLLVFVLAGACAAAGASEAGAVADVNPLIGTGGDGHTFPGATVPFGMIQLSPDTAMPDFHHAYRWAAGYRYDDHSILGFSHTHFSGSGH
jgi:putative alpha-1,2-mannosidase